MGKTRALFKIIRDTKGTFHAKMGTIKDRNGMDLTEVEDIKKRWQEYTEKLYKKDLHDPDYHDDMITHLEPDILESEVKWALGSITRKKASGGDGIPVELFQMLKDDAVKVLHPICQHPDMEQQTGSKLGKGYIKAVYCHPDYLTYMQSTSCKMPGLDEVQTIIQIARRNTNNLRYTDDTTLMAEREEELKSLLMKVKEESGKAGLKLII